MAAFIKLVLERFTIALMVLAPVLTLLGVKEIIVFVRRFLNDRIDFIQQLYDTSTAPYFERQKLIEAREEPYASPDNEDGEPAFLDEWLEARESILVIGCMCISMLSAAFHAYFITWEKRLDIPVDEALKKTVFKKEGWLKGYMTYLSKHFNVDFTELPADLKILQQLILLRNRTQHPETLTDNLPTYSKFDLQKHPNPFFIDERDYEMFSELGEEDRSWLILPSFSVTRDKLQKAIAEVRRFSEWLEGDD